MTLQYEVTESGTYESHIIYDTSIVASFPLGFNAAHLLPEPFDVPFSNVGVLRGYRMGHLCIMNVTFPVIYVLVRDQVVGSIPSQCRPIGNFLIRPIVVSNLSDTSVILRFNADGTISLLNQDIGAGIWLSMQAVWYTP